MKTTVVFTIASWLLFTPFCFAGDQHDADRGLEDSLKATLNQRHVHVHVHHGMVTLTGRVPSDTERQRIDGIVRSTSGVAGVRDQLHVESASPAVAGTVEPRTAIPIYTTPPPEVTPPAVVVTPPAAVVIPQYPKLKVQPASAEDLDLANRIAEQLHADAVPSAGWDNVTINVRNRVVSVRGVVSSETEHDAIVDCLQDTRGPRAIYDELRVR